MITQKQMKEWIPEGVGHFKASMPPVDSAYPEIHIASRKLAAKKRIELVGCTDPEIPYMEFLRGKNGDAILIYQQRFNGREWEFDAKEKFIHILWHELGHFFAHHKENPQCNYGWFSEQIRNPIHDEPTIAYAFWSEFLAETIACRITPVQKIDWESEYWRHTYQKLTWPLRRAFYSGVDYYNLAMYFATLLSDKKTLSFIKAVDDGVVKEWVPGRLSEGLGNRKMIPLKELGFDPTGMNYYHELSDLKECLETLISREAYWYVTIDDLKEIGQKLFMMKVR